MAPVQALSITLATANDVDQVARLADVRRQDYERQQPVFWRPAPDALARHTEYLRALVSDPEVIFLVARREGEFAGYLVGRIVTAPPVYEPGGATCLVDDFAVATGDDWASVGVDLLREVGRRAAVRGAVQAVVVTGRHDEAKRAALARSGLSVASEWWVGPLDG